MQSLYLPLAPTIKLDTDESGRMVSEKLPGLPIQASTLGGLIEIVMHEHDCRIVKNPESDKYFIYYGEKTPEGITVDIHIKRNGISICPKQNLNFTLEENDQIHFGLPAC